MFGYYLLFLYYLVLFFISTDCYLVNMTSYYLNPSLVSNLCGVVVLQSMITLVADSLHVNILLGCFFCSSTSYYLYFLWSEWYFIVTRKFLWSNSFCMCFSFNYNSWSLSPIVSTLFLSYIFLPIQTIFFSMFHKSSRIFYFFIHLIIFLHSAHLFTYILLTSLSWLIYKWIKKKLQFQ